VLYSLFSVMFNWYWRYVSYLKEEIFRLDNILKNAIFEDLNQKKRKKVFRSGYYSPNHLIMVLSSLCWHLENI